MRPSGSVSPGGPAPERDNQRSHGSPAKRERGVADPETDEEEELVVREDGAIAAVAVDDKARLTKLAQQLERRDTELRQAAEYGLALLEANEELQLRVATLQIRLETETDELAAERDAFRRRHEHALLELEHWRRRLARAEDDKAALSERLEAAHAPGGAHVAAGALRRMVAQLQEQVDKLEASAQAQAATVAALRAWKAEAERQQAAAHESEEAAARHSLEMVGRLEREQARLQRVEAQREADARRRSREEREAAEREAQREAQLARLGDELAALRVDNSALREALLTAEARGSRLQRELTLLEHVSYFSEAVVDLDTEDDEDEDEDEEVTEDDTEEDAEDAVPKTHAPASVTEEEPARTLPRSKSSLARRRRSSAAIPLGAYSAFPATSVAADGQRVALTPADVETHTKLHHYFHLTAQSIIHENQLHERCFSTSSRFTIDSWYREIVRQDVPFLEWHGWLIDRISRVAASVREDDGDDRATSTTSRSNGPPSAGSTSATASSASRGSAGSAASARPARVSFSAARAFFRQLWTSNRRRSDASTP